VNGAVGGESIVGKESYILLGRIRIQTDSGQECAV
jgi:hypothetical protein